MDAVRGVAADTVLLDGEIVAIDKRGCPSFQMLQHRASLGRDWQIVYYAFDLLELEDEDLKGRPLSDRIGRGSYAHGKGSRTRRFFMSSAVMPSPK